jgi:hypothetical protein
VTLVVDASVVVAALVDGGVDGEWAEAVLVSAPLAAPHLLLVEVANVLRRASRFATQDCATGRVIDDGCAADGRCASCVNACSAPIRSPGSSANVASPKMKADTPTNVSVSTSV